MNFSDFIKKIMTLLLLLLFNQTKKGTFLYRIVQIYGFQRLHKKNYYIIIVIIIQSD